MPPRTSDRPAMSDDPPTPQSPNTPTTSRDPSKRTFAENIALLESMLNDPNRPREHIPRPKHLNPNMARYAAEAEAIIAKMRAQKRIRPKPADISLNPPSSCTKDANDAKDNDPRTRYLCLPYTPLRQGHFRASFICTHPLCNSLIGNITWGLFIYDASWGIYDPRRRPPFFNQLSSEDMEALPAHKRLVKEVVMAEEDEGGYVGAILEKLGLDVAEEGDADAGVKGKGKAKAQEKKASEVDWTVKSPEEIAFAQYRVDYHAWLHYLLETTAVQWWELGDYMDTQRWKWCLERGRGQNWGDLRGRYVWERRGGI
ncbi:hypothetical protein BJX63DRAFT_344217 [Aspergillus granulosus]|uniref:Uncharacterized protein n=1 Tax=Aspergillus granulosus TaxID=176169 RepID=A0ABR4H2P4_9EURO